MARPEKVFGIGLSRTGTTSLTAALSLLGYQSRHFPKTEEEYFFFDALADTSVAMRFAELDSLYPGSKFIYTVREMESWIASCRAYFRSHPMYAYAQSVNWRLYGCPTFDEALFRSAYVRHDSEIRTHFRSRPKDLLILDICGVGAVWGPLCAFLGRKVPTEPFPRKNARV